MGNQLKRPGSFLQRLFIRIKILFGFRMGFRDIHVNTANRFSLGVDEETGMHYVSIPVSNRLADYEEYYTIAPHMVQDYPDTFDAVMEIVTKCRNREFDGQLIEKPGSDRGVAS